MSEKDLEVAAVRVGRAAFLVGLGIGFALGWWAS